MKGLKMMCIFGLDDITVSVHRQRDIESPGGISPIPETMTMGQALGIGIVVIVHTLSGLSELVRQNAEVIFTLGLPGQDPRLVCSMLGVNLDQAEKLRVLRPGELVVLNPFLWPKALYATFLPPEPPGTCSEEIRKNTVEEFLSKVKTSEPAPLSAFGVSAGNEAKIDDLAGDLQLPGIPRRSIELMVYAGTGIPRRITRTYEQLGLNPTQGRRITKRLEEIGLIKNHTFSTGKRGGAVTLIEVTEAGWKLLKAKGFSKPSPRTSGDWEHEVAAQLLEAEGRRLGFKVSFEVDIGGVRIDVQWLDAKTGSM